MSNNEPEFRCQHCGKPITKEQYDSQNEYCDEDYADYEDNDELQDDDGFF